MPARRANASPRATSTDGRSAGGFMSADGSTNGKVGDRFVTVRRFDDEQPVKVIMLDFHVPPDELWICKGAGFIGTKLAAGMPPTDTTVDLYDGTVWPAWRVKTAKVIA